MFFFVYIGGAAGGSAFPYTSRLGCPVLPAHVAFRQITISRPLGKAARRAGARLEALAAAPHHPVAQPRRLLLPRLFLDQNQGSQGGSPGGPLVGCGPPQQLPGHTDTLSSCTAHCSVAFGEQQPAHNWR